MAYLDYILFVHQKKPATTTKVSMNGSGIWYESGQYFMAGVWNMELVVGAMIHHEDVPSLSSSSNAKVC